MSRGKDRERAEERDAKVAAKDVGWAGLEASDAIDLALYAVYDAQLAVLSALDARVYADEQAKIASM